MKTKSKIVQRILDKKPKESYIFVRLYADIVVRVNTILEEKGMTQKSLADKMGKQPSEIHKWLNREHNLKLSSNAKIETELRKTNLKIPKKENSNKKNKTLPY